MIQEFDCNHKTSFRKLLSPLTNIVMSSRKARKHDDVFWMAALTYVCVVDNEGRIVVTCENILRYLSDSFCFFQWLFFPWANTFESCSSFFVTGTLPADTYSFSLKLLLLLRRSCQLRHHCWPWVIIHSSPAVYTGSSKKGQHLCLAFCTYINFVFFFCCMY